MFITTHNEIISLMPTARWSRPEQLFGYLEEEERVALEPLLGTALYQYLCEEYVRLRETYSDITAVTIKANRQMNEDAGLPYTDVTERLEYIQSGGVIPPHVSTIPSPGRVEEDDMATIRLLRICQQIEFYKMLSHKAGLLTVSFNEGGGMNMISADGYEPADEKRMERVVKDAWMSAGRAVDSLLLFLESDARGSRLFTERWKEADAYYLHKDLLFQTARVLNEYLDIKGERMAYVQLVRDIRFCQNTYLKPRVGAGLMKAVVEWANVGAPDTGGDDSGNGVSSEKAAVMDELLVMLRTALAFYVESRRTSITQVSQFSSSSSSLRNSSTGSSEKEERLARRDSMTDAQQAMAMACDYIEQNLDALGDDAKGSPIYIAVREREAQEERDKTCACAAAERLRRKACEQNLRKVYTGFPATHRGPERK